MRRTASIAAVAGLALAIAGCGDAVVSVPTAVPASASPTVSPAPSASASVIIGSTPSARSTPSASPIAEATMPDFTLTSTAFAAGGSIPRRFTCDGENVSPDLEWSNAPAGTASLLLLVDDPDAQGFVHWLVLDVAGSQSGALPLGISASPDAPAQGTNDFGRVGWGGPCPPSGQHRYTFTLYALGAPLGLAGAPRGGAVRAALGGAQVLGTAILSARYRRGG